jgi:hypothetical protein
MERLSRAIAPVIEHYKEYNHVMQSLAHQSRMLNRRLNRLWARALAPLTKQIAEMTRDWQERSTKMKIRLFEAIEPILRKLVELRHATGNVLLRLLEKLAGVLTKVINGFTDLLRWLGLLKEKEPREPTKKLKPFDIDWPEVKGPLTGAMKRVELQGPPFTTEKRRAPKEEEPETDKAENFGMRSLSRLRDLFDITQGRVPESWIEKAEEAGRRKAESLLKKKNEIKVEVKVGDSHELSAAFENVWRQTAAELRKREAEDMLLAYRLQEVGTYV